MNVGYASLKLDAHRCVSLVNSLAYRLLWPSESDRQIISDLSSLPERSQLIERIKQLGKYVALIFCLCTSSKSCLDVDASTELIYHMYFWSSERAELFNMLNKRSIVSSVNAFFWMAMLTDDEHVQPLFDRTMAWIGERRDEQSLEWISMMVKAKRNQELLDYLVHHDHVE